MDPDVAGQTKKMDESGSPVMKIRKRLSNGTNDEETSYQTEPESSLNSLENGLTCNGRGESEGEQNSDTNESQHDSVKSVLCDTEDNVRAEDDDGIILESTLVSTGSKLFSKDVGDSLKISHNDEEGAVCDSKVDKNCDHVSGDSKDANENCDTKENVSFVQSSKPDPGDDDDDPHVDDMESESICVIANVSSVVSNEDMKSENEGASFIEMETNKRRSGRSSRKNKELRGNEDFEHLDADAKESKQLQNSNKKKQYGKENLDKDDEVDSEGKDKKRHPQELNVGLKKKDKKINHSDAAADIEIIGESKTVHNSTPKDVSQASQNIVFVPSGLSSSGTGQSLLSSSSMPSSGNSFASSVTQNSPVTPSVAQSSLLHGATPGHSVHGIPTLAPGFAFPGGNPGQVTPNMQLLVPTVAPPKPKSSLDQIELIRWEIQNRINTRPKYFKPNSASELGPLSKFLFDIGSDLIKESVYHDLVKIQSKKKGDDKLNAKEKEDLEKLKEIEKDLYATIGHLKLKLKQKCKVCNFQTESSNVMFYHKQYPHEDNKFLRCAHCAFVTKQAIAFKFHVESEHGIQPKLHDKKAFYECDLCPYENNQEQKLTLHKQRCIKQFRPLFNLHPSCLSGAEINLCLENIFYRPIIPKNLKLLQQKHAQQQAALAEARRQQAQMQALAAQKNAAAVAAKKQQQILPKRMPAPITPRPIIPTVGRMPVPPKIPVQQPVRYNASGTKGPCPTVATMLNTKQNAPAPGAAASAAAGGFEVCEICGGYVKDRKALRIHFFYAHRIDLPFNLFERNQAPLYCATCYVRFWTAHGLRKHIDTHKEENQTRGVVGKCISCGHHVLNLLLHMRVVHNREMQHYINALMCMFCGSHFGSHQECERHILKVHGHIDPVTGTLKSTPNAPAAQPQKTPAINNKKQGNNNLVKGSVCVLCNLNFGRNVDLTRHCMRMHHTCMKCGMVVIDKASLMKHTCLSSPSGTRDCTMCGESGFHPAYYVKHLRDKHLKRFGIKVKKLDKTTVEQWTKRPYPFNESDVLVEISDSDEDSPKKQKIQPPPEKTTAKKPRIGPACKIGRRRISLTAVDTLEDNGAVNEDKITSEDTTVSVNEEEAIADTPGESPLGQKRKSSVESPGSDRASKRKK